MGRWGARPLAVGVRRLVSLRLADLPLILRALGFLDPITLLSPFLPVSMGCAGVEER